MDAIHCISDLLIYDVAGIVQLTEAASSYRPLEEYTDFQQGSLERQ